jgi:RES domain-containing protein
MLRGDALRGALDRRNVRGPWLRAIDAQLLTRPPPGFPDGSAPQPLWSGGARLRGGRITPKGSFDTLYLASDLVTVGMELDRVFAGGRAKAAGPPPNPFTIVHVTVDIRGVVDLADGATRRALRTTVAEITMPWRLDRDPITHQLARAAVVSGRILAILAPSAANRRGRILAVFTELLERFPPSQVEAHDASGRLAQRLP